MSDISDDFARGQRAMQHRAAEAVIQSAKGKVLSRSQREILAEAAQAILGLEPEAAVPSDFTPS